MQTVLIIDDEFGIAESLRALLEDEGFRVFCASNGKVGLAKLDEAVPDVIVLDFMMPVMDGYGFLQALRAQPVWSKVPVVMMSAVPEAAVRAHCGDTFQGFLRKPFSINDVLRLLRQVASKPKPPPASSPAPAPAGH